MITLNLYNSRYSGNDELMIHSNSSYLAYDDFIIYQQMGQTLMYEFKTMRSKVLPDIVECSKYNSFIKIGTLYYLYSNSN